MLSKQGRWEEMGRLIDDDMLHAFAVVAGVDEIGAATAERWSGTLQRIGFYAPYRIGGEAMESVVADLKSR